MPLDGDAHNLDDPLILHVHNGVQCCVHNEGGGGGRNEGENIHHALTMGGDSELGGKGEKKTLS